MGPTVGFIGLGQIGAPMAGRVAERFPVVAFDADRDALERLDEAERAESAADVARRSDLVCLSLPSGAISERVVAELVATPEPRAGVIVEMSTVGPDAVRRCAALAEKAGWVVLDAPVSGGVRVAGSGGLSIMASGDPGALDRVTPVLRQIAGQVFVMGDEPGLGQVMKLTNNVIALSALPITSEALTFGEAHGLTLQAMIDVINASSGRTQRSEHMFPEVIIPETFQYGAVGEITQKDVSLFVAEASRVGSPVRIASTVRDLYSEFVAAHPRTDYSRLHTFVEGLAERRDDR